MSLKPEQLINHCEIIISSRRIKNKIVVLCEGEGGIWDKQGRLSPQSYGKMEQMPDANFYKACVPKWWSQYRPEFFNCGDRKDVLDTYCYLLKLHEQDKTNSYLNPEKLFAIVDLDLQTQKIDNYKFSDTEEIFSHLYKELEVNQKNAKEHRIWVTGLIHKEAYFLIPELQSLFDSLTTPPIYNGNNILLHDIYISMADKICDDLDLQKNFQRVSNRINHLLKLDCSCLEKLKDSWKNEFRNNDISYKNNLALALLTIKKAKEYWNQVQAPNDLTFQAEVWREQISLEIGRFYSEQNNSKHHISVFLSTLYELVYQN